MRRKGRWFVALGLVFCAWPALSDAELPMAGNSSPRTLPAGAVATSPTGMRIDICALTAGGHAGAESEHLRLGLAIGEPVAGRISSDEWAIGLGFWHAQAHSLYCAVEITGDVNLSGSLTSADIIHLVNFVFKSGTPPMPCQATGDVNCNGQVASSDIIYLVNYTFKGQAPPCDVCTMIPSVWTCP